MWLPSYGWPQRRCFDVFFGAQECLQLQRALMDLQSSMPSIEPPLAATHWGRFSKRDLVGSTKRGRFQFATIQS